jgi:hypothetical protein
MPQLGNPTLLLVPGRWLFSGTPRAVRRSLAQNRLNKFHYLSARHPSKSSVVGLPRRSGESVGSPLCISTFRRNARFPAKRAINDRPSVLYASLAKLPRVAVHSTLHRSGLSVRERTTPALEMWYDFNSWLGDLWADGRETRVPANRGSVFLPSYPGRNVMMRLSAYAIAALAFILIGRVVGNLMPIP